MSVNYDEIVQALVDCVFAGAEQNWRMGDILLEIEPYGFSLRGLAGGCGRSEGHLRNCKLASATFAPERRALDTDWSVHVMCARTLDGDPEGWLEKAIENGWKTRQLGAAMREAGAANTKPPRPCKQCGYRDGDPVEEVRVGVEIVDTPLRAEL